MKIRIEPIKKPAQSDKAQQSAPKPIRTGIRAGKPAFIVIGS